MFNSISIFTDISEMTKPLCSFIFLLIICSVIVLALTCLITWLIFDFYHCLKSPNNVEKNDLQNHEKGDIIRNNAENQK